MSRSTYKDKLKRIARTFRIPLSSEETVKNLEDLLIEQLSGPTWEPANPKALLKCLTSQRKRRHPWQPICHKSGRL